MTKKVHENLLAKAASFLRQGQYDQAIALLEKSENITMDVSHQLAYGVVLRAAGKLEQAVQVFRKILDNDPQEPRASTYLGMMYLQQGNMREGYQLYNARWDNPEWPMHMPFPREYLWDAKSWHGTQLLLWSEQGYGDTIQFVRYIPWLVSRGIAPTLLCPEALRDLFALIWSNIPVISKFQPGENKFDVHLPLMDLASVCDYQSFNAPYIFLPEKIRNSHSDKLRVGVAWEGRVTHPEDYMRSIFAKLFEQILQTVTDVEWIGLVQNPREIPTSLSDKMLVTADFLELARAVAELDLIITVDTAVAHLAGAMGKPVWVMLSHVPDWRWGLQGNSTSWYPFMRLYRQAAPCDWLPVISAVTSDLASFRLNN